MMVRQYFIPYATLGHRYLFGLSFTNKSYDQDGWVRVRFESGDSKLPPVVRELNIPTRSIIKGLARDWGVTWSQTHEDWMVDLTVVGGDIRPCAFLVDRAGGSTAFVDVIEEVANIGNIIVPYDGSYSWLEFDGVGDWEYVGIQSHCAYSRVIDFQIFQIIFKIIKLVYGIKTTILEGSSVNTSPCGHHNNAHTSLRSIDLRYYFRDDGTVYVEPTAYLLSKMAEVWPGCQLIVGTSLEQDLSSVMSRGNLHRMKFDDRYDHKVDHESARSHIHGGINSSKVNQEVML